METKFIGDERMKLYCADCLKVLPTLENESVHAVVCNPENCVTLCHACHLKRHAQLRHEKKRFKLGVKPLEEYK